MVKFLLPTWRTAHGIWASEMHFFVEIQRVPHQKFNRSRSWTTTFIWPCGLMCFLTFFMPRYLFFDTVQATLLMQSEAHALGGFVHVCIFLGLGGWCNNVPVARFFVLLKHVLGTSDTLLMLRF